MNVFTSMVCKSCALTNEHGCCLADALSGLSQTHIMTFAICISAWSAPCGAERIDPLCFLWRDVVKRRLNQALSLVSLSIGFV